MVPSVPRGDAVAPAMCENGFNRVVTQVRPLAAAQSLREMHRRSVSWQAWLVHLEPSNMRAYLFVVALSVGGVLACGAPPASTSPSAGVTPMNRPTEPFRTEHAKIKEHLSHMSELVGSLAKSSPDEQRAVMNQFVGFMREHIKPHAEWEEKVLYPAVDKRAAPSPHPFTASMRYEHGIVVRWTDELANIASQPAPDAAAFTRRADNLLGLVLAHFEEEEEVLLPILDKALTKEQFEREIGHHGE